MHEENHYELELFQIRKVTSLFADCPAYVLQTLPLQCKPSSLRSHCFRVPSQTKAHLWKRPIKSYSPPLPANVPSSMLPTSSLAHSMELPVLPLGGSSTIYFYIFLFLHPKLFLWSMSLMTSTYTSSMLSYAILPSPVC